MSTPYIDGEDLDPVRGSFTTRGHLVAQDNGSRITVSLYGLREPDGSCRLDQIVLQPKANGGFRHLMYSGSSDAKGFRKTLIDYIPPDLDHVLGRADALIDALLERRETLDDMKKNAALYRAVPHPDVDLSQVEQIFRPHNSNAA